MKARRTSRGFTLIELIVVVSIIAVIVLMVAPAFGHISRAMNLRSAANMIGDELNLARQVALAQNRNVEVRFYKLTGELGDPPAYRAFRTYVALESGLGYRALSGLKRLHTSMIVTDDEKFSTLLNDKVRPQVATEKEDLPLVKDVPYKTIRFRPTGGTELPPYTSGNDNWFLTVKPQTDRAEGDRPASNFFTIQVDPVNGRVRNFRP